MIWRIPSWGLCHVLAYGMERRLLRSTKASILMRGTGAFAPHMGMHPLVAWSKAVAFNEDGQPLATGERA